MFLTDCGIETSLTSLDCPTFRSFAGFTLNVGSRRGSGAGPAARAGPRDSSETTDTHTPRRTTISSETRHPVQASTGGHPRTVEANGLETYVDQVGQRPDVLLIGGLGDTVESWQFQLDGLADRYRLTAFDNRGAGRTPMPEGPVSVEAMADDAAEVLRALEIPSAHVAGFSGGSIIAQELALRDPALVRSLVLQSTWPVMDPCLRTWARFVRWLVQAAPSERDFLEWFFMFIYTPRANNDGTVDQIIEEVLAFRTSRRPRTPSARSTPSSTTT